MPDDAMDLNDEGVEAAARVLYDRVKSVPTLTYDIAYPSEQDDFRRVASAMLTAYLRAVPESDEQRDKADQWDAAQPMIAAMTDVVVVARKMHTDSRVRLLNAYDWMELTNALNAVTRLSPDEAAGGE